MTQTNLLNHLWQSTLFAAAAGLLRLALRKNRAPVRYWLWFAASVKFLIPFSLLVTIGSQFEWRAAPAAAPAQFFSVVNEISQPIALPAQLPRPAKEPEAPTVLLGLWLCGVSVVAYAWARQWLRVRAALRVASPLHLTLPIRAMSSPARLEPGVFGVFRPVLLLPEGITDRLTPSQWNAILAHELCHVRRRDNLTAAIHMAVEAIFWFHPLVWWIGKRLIDERERACDEEVLLTANDPQGYAEGILNVCKLYLESPLACVSGVTGSNLKQRIRAIMTQRVAGNLTLAKKLTLAIAGMAALALPTVVGILHAPELRGQSQPTTRRRNSMSHRLSPINPGAVVRACRRLGAASSQLPTSLLKISCLLLTTCRIFKCLGRTKLARFGRLRYRSQSRGKPAERAAYVDASVPPRGPLQTGATSRKPGSSRCTSWWRRRAARNSKRRLAWERPVPTTRAAAFGSCLVS